MINNCCDFVNIKLGKIVLFEMVLKWWIVMIWNLKKNIFNEIELILNYDFGVLDKWLKKDC